MVKDEIKDADILLRVDQVAKRLSCSGRHVYNLINQGILPGFKIGGRNGFRVRLSKLEEFILEREDENGLF
ncbi:MAG TPA: DNA-binding protein [Desulfobacteraceae bacterium]|nr:DNA-binding protein [Desulfobacteraceae bacterium]|tara:strand:- start:2863 stop:3075 length:213 start_codon:yes stop_codon:yes gene_type:complete